MVMLGKDSPNFELDAYLRAQDEVKRIKLAEFKGKWVVLVFYPADFTFVCPTELEDVAKNYSEIQKLGAEVISISTDTVWSHKAWVEQEQILKGIKYPMAADPTGNVSRAYGIYDEVAGVAKRGCFIIDPDGKLKAIYCTDDPVGRSAREIIRMLKAFKFVRENPGNVCPASWDDGLQTLKPSIKIAGKVSQQLKK